MKKNILLTSGRFPATLELARLLHSAGHRVYVADTSRWHFCRFSNAVIESLKIPSPRFHFDAFIAELSDIIEEKNIDLLIPTFEEILYVAKGADRLPPTCELFCPPFEVLHTLHNKWLFNQKQKELGFLTPESHLIESREDLEKVPLARPYILKPVYSRASQGTLQINSNDPLSEIAVDPKNPWIAQERIEGKHICAHSICRDGELLAQAIYPVHYSIQGQSCLIMEAIEHPKIRAWVEEIIHKIHFTGQLAFDFIETPSGELYCIDCNPRATSGLHLFTPEDQIDRFFLGQNHPPVHAKPGRRKQLATGMALYGWRPKARSYTLGAFFKQLFTTPDVVLSTSDIRPFLSMPLLGVHYMHLVYKSRLPFLTAFTHDIDWNG